jgi:hypothetical protein
MAIGDKVRLLPPWDKVFPGEYTVIDPNAPEPVIEAVAEVIEDAKVDSAEEAPVFLEGLDAAFAAKFVEVVNGSK